MRMMFHQVENVSKEIKIMSQIEIELKVIISEIKNSEGSM